MEKLLYDKRVNYLLSSELASKLVAYLTKQPYEEVNDLIQKLTTLQSVNVLPPQEKILESTSASPKI